MARAPSPLTEAFPFRAAARAEPYQDLRRIPAGVILDCVRSLYNVGSFFRSADAAGMSKLYLTGYTGRPPHPGIAKTALGAEQTMPWEHHQEALALLDHLRTKDHEIAIIETSVHAVDLYDWKPRFPVALVFGNEVEGVPPQLSERADLHVRIPTLGQKQSLNVAVAGGIVMYELLRKYRLLHEEWRR
jgi:23S rRNA (guanosine2251-2'-O)-methyltransferase